MTGAALLIDEMDDQGETAFRAIAFEILDIADTPDPDFVRVIAERVNAAFQLELHQIKLGIAYDRYA
ncbi:hypothetical protein SAMN04489859_106514 [Paracoccus alcaliphilus]|uniref:Uncharacterized protein n=1 Tax=Paracoccus alcaliphilus TaxID=34002 RepID=A0A1H8NMX3_9RHOB|nr:hypothetical protein [Paracoccus alcaliphilus]WCR17482.1 hypothetical protein JHW40_14260 [Paracoccus alcaliphilus]SEO30922.1 hypothetical protein SAMN04489859_106514 [Paracoccus alcaliphilus]